MLSKLRHPNILSTCGIVTDRNILVTELMEASLPDVIQVSLKCQRYLTVREQIDLAVGCANGVAYLHQLQPCSAGPTR